MKPLPNEKQSDFMSRCMSDPSMKKEYATPGQCEKMCATMWNGQGMKASIADLNAIVNASLPHIAWGNKPSDKKATGKKPPDKSKPTGPKYLVTESDGTTHLPYTDNEGNLDHAKAGAAYAALTVGFRGQVYQGPNKAQALATLKGIYKSQGWAYPGA